MKTVVRILAVLAALLALPASANFHLWSMSELYSNADGSVQFIELRALTTGQQFVSGHSIAVSGNGTPRTFEFDHDLGGDSAGHTFLVGTQSFANLHIVAPDFIVPDHFFFTDGGTVTFAEGADRWTYPALPSDGRSLNRDGSTGPNSPKNFGGATGSVPASTTTPPPAAFNVEALWWNDPDGSEGGWGVNIVHHGNILFVSWFTYDIDGSGMWLFMSSVTQSSTNPNSYSGEIYRSTASPFNNFNPASFQFATVGTGTFTFRDAGHGTFAYTVNGNSQVKNIKRFEFGTVPTCDQSGAVATNFTDLWYKPSEAGWGVNVIQQGDLIFASWFTYDATGKGMWIYGSNIARTSGNTFSGPIATNVGPPFTSSPWDATRVHLTVVGNATFAFTDPNNATFTYTVNGITQSKAITRDIYAFPATTCR